MNTYPEPGVYRGISDAEYHAWEYCSATRLSALLDSSMEHIWAAENQPTESMQLGTLVHLAVLQPAVYKESVVVSPYPTLRSADAKKWLAEQQAAGRVVATDDMAGIAGLAARRVLAHRAASTLLNASVEREVSLVFDWRGIRCKSRIDCISKVGDEYFVVDVKTTSSAHAESFASSVARFRYHMQMAFYRHAVSTMLPQYPVCGVFLVAVENKPPCAVQVFRLAERALTLGDALVEEAMLKWAAGYCYPEDPVNLDLPAWAYKEATRGC